MSVELGKLLFKSRYPQKHANSSLERKALRASLYCSLKPKLNHSSIGITLNKNKKLISTKPQIHKQSPVNRNSQCKSQICRKSLNITQQLNQFDKKLPIQISRTELKNFAQTARYQNMATSRQYLIGPRSKFSKGFANFKLKNYSITHKKHIQNQSKANITSNLNNTNSNKNQTGRYSFESEYSLRRVSLISENVDNIDHYKRMDQIKLSFKEEAFKQRIQIFGCEKNRKEYTKFPREDLSKFIIQRYGRDRITHFLKFQNFLTYSSFYKNIQILLELTKQQMLLFVFIIFDQSKDAVISVEDLMGLSGAKKINSDVNPLIMEDINYISHYLSEKQQQHPAQKSGNPNYKFLRDDEFNLISYRLQNYKRMKEELRTQMSETKNKRFNVSRSQHLYTVQSPTENECKMQNLLQKQRLPSSNDDKSSLFLKRKNILNITISFDTFKNIFNDRIPKTFLDALYLLGGLKMPNENYLSVRVPEQSVKMKTQNPEVEKEFHPGIQKVTLMLHKMKELREYTEMVYNMECRR